MEQPVKDELSEVLFALEELYKQSERHQKNLFSPLMLLLNDIYDAVGPQMDGELSGKFYDLLAFIEGRAKIMLHTLSMDSFTNLIYYFCKFRAGEDQFWAKMENSVIKNKDGMSAHHLCRVLLALVMNYRPVPHLIAEHLIGEILLKFDKVSAHDIFSLSIALGKGNEKIPHRLISSDLYYSIYLRLMTAVHELDLY